MTAGIQNKSKVATQFQNIMGAPFEPKRSNVVDIFIYSVLEAAEKGDTKTLLPLLANVKDFMALENQRILLLAASCLAKGDQTKKNDKIDFLKEKRLVQHLVGMSMRKQLTASAIGTIFSGIALVSGITYYNLSLAKRCVIKAVGHPEVLTGTLSNEGCEIRSDDSSYFLQDLASFKWSFLYTILGGTAIFSFTWYVLRKVDREADRIFSELQSRQKNVANQTVKAR